MTDQGQVGDNTETTDRYAHYNPVHVRATDSLGAIVAGILAFSLLIALLRSEARNRRLLAQRSQR